MLLMESIGTTDVEITKLITQQLGEITQDNRKFDIQKLNYALALVQAVEPRDEMETMLATQMAAIHLATMVQARRLQGAESVQQAEANSKSLNALARTFAQQMETLKKYRGGNQQKVVVEHVHVYSGGQAVVGAVNAKEGAPA
ncbi:MAG TPA: hypothetical protein VGO22_15830 [Pseudorhizobium sp.]|nr:hypothetical protein [Pseudorhizobium sp.]